MGLSSPLLLYTPTIQRSRSFRILTHSCSGNRLGPCCSPRSGTSFQERCWPLPVSPPPHPGGGAARSAGALWARTRAESLTSRCAASFQLLFRAEQDETLRRLHWVSGVFAPLEPGAGESSAIVVDMRQPTTKRRVHRSYFSSHHAPARSSHATSCCPERQHSDRENA